jgi:serine/threonine protein kinase
VTTSGIPIETGGLNEDEDEDENSRPAAFLVGRDLVGGWRVMRRISTGPGGTGGTFSVGYEIEGIDEDGNPTSEIAFLKALDYSKWPKFGETAVSAIALMTEAFQFEVELVEVCAKRGMKNVVRGIGSGTVNVGDGLIPQVDYIIFEKAKGDIRQHIDSLSSFDCAWSLRVLHNVTSGLAQLHRAEVFHQDIKPSNIMIYPEAHSNEQSRIGDLGRASRTGRPARHDAFQVKGDPLYAPPENLYNFALGEVTRERLAADTYLLGSMAVFMFTKCGVTERLLERLHPAFRPPTYGGTWGGTFEQVLPHLRDAHNEVMEEFYGRIDSKIPQALRDEITLTTRQLCDPDPRMRGVPKKRSTALQQYSMEIYTSRFDFLSAKANIELKKQLT